MQYYGAYPLLLYRSQISDNTRYWFCPPRLLHITATLFLGCKQRPKYAVVWKSMECFG